MPTNYPLYTESPYGFTEGKVVLANRVYTAPTGTARPGVAAAGATPAGWTDLGSILDSKVTIDKADPEVIEIETGLFQVLRNEVGKKEGLATAKFTMVEYEPAAWAALTGDAVIGGNSIFVGGRPISQFAVLLVGQNPATGTEFQHWNPKGDMQFKITDNADFTVIDVTFKFLKFNDIADVQNLGRDFRIDTYAHP